MSFVYKVFGAVMLWCYHICGNYGWAILFFTLLSKLVLMPLSVWVQKNSIKMVKMQPEINMIKVKHFGDKDQIAEEEAKIYKREKYSPFASIIPLLAQLFLLMGVIEGIKAGMSDGTVNMAFFGINLGLIPSSEGISLIFSPIIAGFSAWLLCIAQNASNVLQSEQSKLNKYGMMAFSVGLSLYLGWFVSIGVAWYWVCSNLLAIAQLYFLNWLINPKKYVDYEKLEASKKELDEISNCGSKSDKISRADRKREKEDYKKFFSVVNKHLVFYSESSGFYKYFQGIVEYILHRTNITLHYITSDPNDAIFELAKSEPNLRPYYIGEKRLITLMMKMDADVVVMTMPDLENYHIKRSYLRDDIKYIFIPHSMDSLNMTMRKASMDHFDAVLCTGKHQMEEISKTEIAYNLPKKDLVEWGYCLLDKMREDYQKSAKTDENPVKTILVAPSWQKDNIVDSCLDELLDNFKDTGYKIIVRPHPQHVRHMPEKMEQLKAKFADNDLIEIQTDFSSNSTVFEADMMITDWSGIAYEYAFTTCKPVLFIDTPMKIMNPEYQRIDTVPINIWMRNEIGATLKPEEMNKIVETSKNMLDHSKEYYEKIDAFVHEYVYNLGNSSEVGAKYIIQSIQDALKKRKESR
ncbi:MAG: membrane protein insertase YidC [Lachnospiraceae bacterium]